MQRTYAVLVGLVVSLLVATTPAAAAASPSFVVSLQDDGSADLTVTYTFDLDGDAERQAFGELRSNQSAREAYVARFDDRLSSVAANAADRTGREMAVTDVTVDVEMDGDTGVVTLTATWEGLAAVEGEEVVVGEPFAGGFEPDRPFVVEVPDGYEVDTVTPSPSNREDGRLTWNADSSLDGFSLTATRSAGTTTGLGPGFGVAGGLVAILIAALLARRTE